ncbi:hypothetical protein BGZ76_008621, partial [Entomortierella beljakovae]
IQQQQLREEQERRNTQAALENLFLKHLNEVSEVEDDEEEEEEEEEEEDPLSNLLNALFFPHSQLKRQQPQDQAYPCKRHRQQQQAEQKKRIELEKKKAQEALKAKQEQEEKAQKVLKAKQEQEKAAAIKKAESEKDEDEDFIGNYFLTFPDIKSMVEAALGAKAEVATSEKKPESPAIAAKPTEKKTSAPSSAHSSPELFAADLLKKRQARKEQKPEQKVEEKEEKPEDQQQKKHSELNSINKSLEDLSHELDSIIAGTIENKKQILLTEENLTKTMLRLDSVQSDGDMSIRNHRKQLIKKSQDLLDLVDEFKARDNKKTSTNDSESESEVEEDTAELDTLSVSEIESLPDTVEESTVEEPEEEVAESSKTTLSAPVQVEATENMEVEPELSHSTDSETSEDESEELPVQSEVSSTKPSKDVDPFDQLIDAALSLSNSESLDHDFEMVIA